MFDWNNQNTNTLSKLQRGWIIRSLAVQPWSWPSQNTLKYFWAHYLVEKANFRSATQFSASSQFCKSQKGYAWAMQLLERAPLQTRIHHKPVRIVELSQWPWVSLTSTLSDPKLKMQLTSLMERSGKYWLFKSQHVLEELIIIAYILLALILVYEISIKYCMHISLHHTYNLFSYSHCPSYTVAKRSQW